MKLKKICPKKSTLQVMKVTNAKIHNKRINKPNSIVHPNQVLFIFVMQGRFDVYRETNVTDKHSEGKSSGLSNVSR